MTSIEKEITKQQNKLIQEAKNKGIYEEFGQKEVRMIEERFINTSDYSKEMNERRAQVIQFENWCMDYCG